MKERRKIKVNREKRERRQVEFISRENSNASGLSELAMNLPPSVAQKKTQMHRTGVEEKTKLTERPGIGALGIGIGGQGEVQLNLGCIQFQDECIQL